MRTVNAASTGNHEVPLKVLRHITKALEVSLDSTHKRVGIGTVIARGVRIIAQAPNVDRSHPRQREWNERTNRLAPNHRLHSELNAILHAGREVCLRDATAYIGRYNRDGTLGNCRPCVSCRAALLDVGIRSIYYTHPTRGVIFEQLQ